MNTPTLRFKEFSGAWEVKKLGDVNIYISDGNYGEQYPKAEEMKQSGVPFIRANNFNGLALSWKDMKFIDNSLHETLTSGHLEAHDILVTTRGDIGMVVYVDKEFHGANINAQICLLRIIDNNKLNTRYLLQLLSSSYCQKQFKELQTGSALKQLPKKSLTQINILHSSIEEQTKIANFLTAIDEKIAQLSQAAQLLTDYKKGVMQQIFSQQLRFKDDDGREFAEWEEKSLGDVASFIKDGTHGTHQDTVNGEYLLLSAKNIKNGQVYYDEFDRRISKSEFESMYKNYELYDGDILLSVVGSIGRVAVYSSALHKKIAFQRSVAFFRFKNESSEFIAQLFTSTKFQNDLLTNQVVSAQAGIYLGDLAKIRIDLPSLPEQTKIANFLTAIDDKLTSSPP